MPREAASVQGRGIQTRKDAYVLGLLLLGRWYPMLPKLYVRLNPFPSFSNIASSLTALPIPPSLVGTQVSNMCLHLWT